MLKAAQIALGPSSSNVSPAIPLSHVLVPPLPTMQLERPQFEDFRSHAEQPIKLTPNSTPPRCVYFQTRGLWAEAVDQSLCSCLWRHKWIYAILSAYTMCEIG